MNMTQTTNVNFRYLALFKSKFDHKYGCKSPHLKKVFKNLWKFTSQTRLITILIQGAYCIYLKVIFKW